MHLLFVFTLFFVDQPQLKLLKVVLQEFLQGQRVPQRPIQQVEVFISLKDEGNILNICFQIYYALQGFKGILVPAQLQVNFGCSKQVLRILLTILTGQHPRFNDGQCLSICFGVYHHFEEELMEIIQSSSLFKHPQTQFFDGAHRFDIELFEDVLKPLIEIICADLIEAGDHDIVDESNYCFHGFGVADDVPVDDLIVVRIGEHPNKSFLILHKSNKQARTVQIVKIIILCHIYFIDYSSFQFDNQNIREIEMFRGIPTNNKICFDKHLKRSWKIHEKKLREIKSTLSLNKPAHYTFLDQRAKKSALQEVRNNEIEKENSCLLTKIKNISSKSLKGKCRQSVDAKKSLNLPYRKRENVKIEEENQEMMKRLQMKKSMFDVKKWEKERMQIEKNITLISEFPYKNYPSTHVKVNMWMTDENLLKRSKADPNSPSFNKNRPRNLNFQGTKKIGENYYLVETFLSKKIFTVEMENLEDANDRHRIQLGEEEIYEVLESKLMGEIRNLMERLSIDSDGKCSLRFD